MISTRLFLLILLFLTIGISSYAQKSDHRFKERYAADFAPGETEVKSAYQWVITITAEGDYIRRFYYPETRQITGLVRYSDKKLRRAHGPARSWYESGQLQSEYNYHMNELDGPYLTYYESGELASRGTYSGGEKASTWEHFDEAGTLKRTESYTAGKLEGMVTYYDSTGTLVGSAAYTSDRPANGCDSLSRIGEYACTASRERLPLYPGCETIVDYAERKKCADRRMLEFVYSNVRYPARARRFGVEGMAVVGFVVERDGQVTNIRPIRSLNEDIREEILRIVGLLPRWEPGTADGEPVRVQFNLPIKFQLE